MHICATVQHAYEELIVVFSCIVYRLFDLSSDMDKAEQEFYLQPGECGRSHGAVSICPVAFSFGEHLWESFSVSATQTFSEGTLSVFKTFLCTCISFKVLIDFL